MRAHTTLSIRSSRLHIRYASHDRAKERPSVYKREKKRKREREERRTRSKERDTVMTQTSCILVPHKAAGYERERALRTFACLRAASTITLVTDSLSPTLTLSLPSSACSLKDRKERTTIYGCVFGDTQDKF